MGLIRTFIPQIVIAVGAIALSCPVYASGEVLELTLPAVPASLTVPADRADYILSHFWDNMDFADTVRSHDRRFMEQNFVNYLSVFPHARPQAVDGAVQGLIASAGADHDALTLISELADTYLFSSGSPMRSEESYLPFVKALASSPVLAPGEKERARWLAVELAKCRPGTQAPDFRFVDKDGNSMMLSAVHSSGKDILLFFYDPECDTCHEEIRRMIAAPDSGVAVVAVCAGDDAGAWRSDLQSMPEEWIVGFPDEPVDDLYPLWEMPTVYRLTPDFRIMDKVR